MFKFLTILLKLVTFQRVDELTPEGGKKPWYITRRFLGLVVSAVVALLVWQKGLEIGEDTIETIVNNLELLVVALYGIGQVIIGIVNRKKNA